MQFKKPISILHLITTLDVGGAEMMLLKLLSFMDLGVFSNQVVGLTAMGQVGKKISDRGFPVYALNMPSGRLTMDGLIRLWRILRFSKPTILQTWLYHADFLGLLFGKCAGVKNICWNIRCSYRDLGEHGLSTRLALRLCTLLSFLPKTVIVNSQEGLKYHSQLGYKPKQWKMIPNGFDLKRFRPNRKGRGKILSELGLDKKGRPEKEKKRGPGHAQPDTVLIGLIARYAPIKDHPLFIDAGRLLLEKRIDVHFVLAGRDVTWENRTLADRIPDRWKGHFHLLGERGDVEKITAALDIASLVSYGEGFPNIICEAMACGVPCVVTDVGDSARIVGDAGRVVPCRDPEAVAAAWNELIDLGEEGRRGLGLAARQRVKERFDLSDAVRKYENLYASIAAS